MSRISKKNQYKIAKVVGIIVAALLVLAVVFDLTPFGGTIKYYSTWVGCGHTPVVIGGSGFFNTGVSHYYTPPKVAIFPGGKTYFCTAFDAEKHGYSANSEEYNFPVLKANNALCKKTTDPEPETAAIFLPCKE